MGEAKMNLENRCANYSNKKLSKDDKIYLKIMSAFGLSILSAFLLISAPFITVDYYERHRDDHRANYHVTGKQTARYNAGVICTSMNLFALGAFNFGLYLAFSKSRDKRQDDK